MASTSYHGDIGAITTFRSISMERSRLLYFNIQV